MVVYLHEGVFQGSHTVLELLHLGTNTCQLLVGSIQTLVGICLRCTLWSNHLQCTSLSQMDSHQSMTLSILRGTLLQIRGFITLPVNTTSKSPVEIL